MNNYDSLFSIKTKLVKKLIKKGLFDKETAYSFRKNILERGNTEDPMKLYVRYRGQEPSIEPLLKKRGLK